MTKAIIPEQKARCNQGGNCSVVCLNFVMTHLQDYKTNLILKFPQEIGISSLTLSHQLISNHNDWFSKHKVS